MGYVPPPQPDIAQNPGWSRSPADQPSLIWRLLSALNLVTIKPPAPRRRVADRFPPPPPNNRVVK